MRFSLCLAAALLSLSALSPAAATETFTPSSTRTASPTPTATPSATITSTFTVSPTPTPGPGIWDLTLSPNSSLLQGVAGQSAVWTYTTDVPWTAGKLLFRFPADVEAPGSLNFSSQPQAGVGPYNYNGQDAEVQLNNIPAGTRLSFYYGFNTTGFAVAASPSALSQSFQVYAQPNSLTITPAPVTPVSLAAAVKIIVSTTITPTSTPTGTITTTPTMTPTVTETFTITQTWTETPVAAAPADGLLCYPNPFDLRQFNKVTIRFQPVASAEVQIFNLAGEPIRKLDYEDIFAANGWALWHGEDDYLRKVPGGIYFVRVRTPDKALVRRFTVLR